MMHSSPVLWGDKVFITTGDDKRPVGGALPKASDGSKPGKRSFGWPYRKQQ